MKNVKGFKLNVTREFGSWRGEDASLGFVIACIATKGIIGAIAKDAIIPDGTERPIDAGKAVIATGGRSGTTRRQINRDPGG